MSALPYTQQVKSDGEKIAWTACQSSASLHRFAFLPGDAKAAFELSLRGDLPLALVS